MLPKPSPGTTVAAPRVEVGIGMPLPAQGSHDTVAGEDPKVVAEGK